jgi:hypothetical protein
MVWGWLSYVPQRLMGLKSSSSGWHYWEVVEPLRGRAFWEVLGSLGACPQKGAPRSL